MQRLTCLLMTLAILAGCASGPSTVTQSQEPTPNVGSARVAPPGAPEEEHVQGGIQGTVVDGEAAPISGATVRLAALRAAVIANEAGFFEFTAVPQGEHLVEAQAPGYGGQAKIVNVEPSRVAKVSFVLEALVADVPHVEVFTHVTMINVSFAGFEGQVNSDMCSDLCRWFFAIPGEPDVLAVEVYGGHSVPHPRGWDGLRVRLVGHPFNATEGRVLRDCNGGFTSDVNAECLRLPLMFFVNRSMMDKDMVRWGPTERLRFVYYCEEGWICLDDRYETYLSIFYGYREEEIPPGYAAGPAGGGFASA